MKNKTPFSIGIFLLFILVSAAFSKERAVLLPLSGPLTPNEKMILSKEVSTVLESKYTLVAGEEVDRFVKQVFLEESHKTECDESSCYRRISEHYHADNIIAFRVTKMTESSYLITFNLYDVPTGEMTLSRNQECTECSFEKLKALSNNLIRMEKK